MSAEGRDSEQDPDLHDRIKLFRLVPGHSKMSTLICGYENFICLLTGTKLRKK